MSTKRHCEGCEASVAISQQVPGIFPGSMGPGGMAASVAVQTLLRGGGPAARATSPLRGLQAVQSVPGVPDAPDACAPSEWLTVDPHGCGAHTLDFCSPKCAAANVERVVGQLNVRIEAERKAFEKTMSERPVGGFPVLFPPTR